MTALSCSLAYRADGAEAHFPPGTLIPTLCIIEGLPAAMYTISLPYLCFFAAITAGEAAGSECANSTRKGLLQSGPNKSAGAKGRIEPFAPALICIRGRSAVYPPEQPSGAAPPTKALAQTASPHCNHEEKRRVSNELTRLFQSVILQRCLSVLCGWTHRPKRRRSFFIGPPNRSRSNLSRPNSHMLAPYRATNTHRINAICP